MATRAWLSSEILYKSPDLMSWAVLWSSRIVSAGVELRLQNHHVQLKQWVASGATMVFGLLKLKTAFLLEFRIDYLSGYSAEKDRMKLKLRIGKIGSFSRGGWMHWETPAASQGAGKCLPALYFWFKRKTQLCSISAAYCHMAGWRGREQGGGQKNLACIWTWAMMEHMNPVWSFCSWAHLSITGEQQHSRRW